MDAKQVILMLLDVLPDTDAKTESWEWCWNELFEDAQEEVKGARRIAEQWLASQVEEIIEAE